MNKKSLILIAAIIAIGGLAVTYDKLHKEGQEATKVVDSIAQDKEVIAFIIDMYDNQRYVDYDFLRKHCSKKMRKQLADEYDYDDDGLAVWSFRTGAQDQKDTTDVSRVISVEVLDNHWYAYSYLDMGWRGEQKLLIEKQGDTFIIKDKKEIYNECKEIKH